RRREPDRAVAPGRGRLARGGARPAGLERWLAFARRDLQEPARRLPRPRHVQRLLGAAVVRAAAHPRGSPRRLAPNDRHRARLTRRPLSLARGARRGAGGLPGAAALGRRPGAAALATTMSELLVQIRQDAYSAALGKERDPPLEHDEEPIGEPDEEEDVDPRPQQPGEQPGEAH